MAVGQVSFHNDKKVSHFYRPAGIVTALLNSSLGQENPSA